MQIRHRLDRRKRDIVVHTEDRGHRRVLPNKFLQRGTDAAQVHLTGDDVVLIDINTVNRQRLFIAGEPLMGIRRG